MAATRKTENQQQLTVSRPDPHVLEGNQAGPVNDDFDGLLAIEGAHVTLAFRVFAADGSFKGKVVRPRDMDTRHAVVPHLRDWEMPAACGRISSYNGYHSKINVLCLDVQVEYKLEAHHRCM